MELIASHRAPGRSSIPSTRSMPAPSGSASSSRVRPGAAQGQRQRAGEDRRPRPARAAEHPDRHPGPDATVGGVGEHLDQPGVGHRQLRDVLGPDLEGPAEQVVGHAVARHHVHPGTPRRGQSGQRPGQVGAHQHQRGRGPRRAARSPSVAGDLRGRTRGSGEPEQVVEQQVVVGDQQGSLRTTVVAFMGAHPRRWRDGPARRAPEPYLWQGQGVRRPGCAPATDRLWSELRSATGARRRP